MARNDALLRLHKSLTARRAELRRRLGGELEDLRNVKTTDATGDSADAAFDSGSEEIASQLAELESRELSQIERAILRMKQGTYGHCEGCQIKIPVARLNALPYSTTCVKCQREVEMYGQWADDRGGENWEKVSEVESPLDDQPEIDLSDLEMDLSK
jgi:DnaK suppressor protein